MNVTAFLRTAGALLGGLLIISAAGGATGYACYTARVSTGQMRDDALQHARDTARGLAASYADQIGRQLLGFDQTLEAMVRDQEANPARFNLKDWQAKAVTLNGVTRDMFMTDETGIIRQSTVPEFLGQSAADLDIFRQAADRADKRPGTLVGLTTVNPIMRQWHLDIVRVLHKPDGSFGGMIDAEYRILPIAAMFQAANPPEESFIALTGLIDGKLRASIGPRTPTPGASIADSQMFAAVDAADSGVWVGPSAPDAAIRIHAFRHIPGRDLAVIAGVSQAAALRPVEERAFQTRLYAIAVTALSALIVLFVAGTLIAARRRAAGMRIDRANLASANALAEVSRVQREAVSRRLSAAFSAVNDGLAIFDAHLNLLEWNPHFPERLGVNPSFVRVGMPMEELLRFQAEAGAFGPEVEPEAEVERRAALLRAGTFDGSLRFQAAGRFIEPRYRPLAEGGFIALLVDVTEARQSRQAVRDAMEAMDRARSARGRVLAAISHEWRDRMGILTRAIEALRAAVGDGDAVSRVARTAAHAAAVADETDDMLAMETDSVVPTPALLAVEPMIRDAVDRFQPIAADGGLTVWPVIAPDAPEELVADRARVRQLAGLLLLEASRIAEPDTMWLIADAGGAEERDSVSLRLTVRCFGPPLSPERRAAMFPGFDTIAPPGAKGDGPRAGTGLERAILGHLARVMGGVARCESWSTDTGRTGNDLIVTLPMSALPARLGRPADGAGAEPTIPARTNGAAVAIQRTRVLLAGPATGLRMAAMTLLRREGHLVDTVPTGRRALEVLGSTPYDIVFLDSAPPDMPLVSLATEIRELPGATRSIPLIALAPPHEDLEEQRWRAAGIDGVLADPPSFADLTAAIHRAVWLSTAPVREDDAMTVIAAATEEGIPILSAERVTELRDNIQAAQLAEMVEEAIVDLQQRLTPLRRALSASANGAILTQAHTMVGVAAGYGMTVVAARLRAIMTAARENRLDTIAGAADVVETDISRAAAALRQVLKVQTSALHAPSR